MIIFTGEGVPLTKAPIPTCQHDLPKQVFGCLFVCYLTGRAEQLFGFDIARHVAGTIDVRETAQPCSVIDPAGIIEPATLFIQQRYGSISPDNSNPLGTSPRGYIVLNTDEERLAYHKGTDGAANRDKAVLAYVRHALTGMRRRGVAPAGSGQLINELSDYSGPLKQLLYIEEMQAVLRQWRDNCPAYACGEFDHAIDGLEKLIPLLNK